MAWSHGFIIEYDPRLDRKRKRKKRKKKKQPQEEKPKNQKATEAKATKPKKAKRRKAKKKKDPHVGSVLSVKGLHVGRTVRDRSGKMGRVVSLKSTEATVDFEDGSTRRFKVPNDFADHEVSVVNVRKQKTEGGDR